MDTKPSVTLIGTFRKDPVGLRSIFNELNGVTSLMCPKSIDFIDSEADFVKAAHEYDDSVNKIENKVLDTILVSDFVWLFAPKGYVGTSAAFEMGFAHLSGVPIFTNNVLNDEMLRSMVSGVVSGPSKALRHVSQPGKALSRLQEYYKKASVGRGWSRETPQDIMLLLTEEIGELARAVRKSSGIRRDHSYGNIKVGEEIADVQLYLVHLANSLNISMSEAIADKEKKNEARFRDTKE